MGPGPVSVGPTPMGPVGLERESCEERITSAVDNGNCEKGSTLVVDSEMGQTGDASAGDKEEGGRGDALAVEGGSKASPVVGTLPPHHHMPSDAAVAALHPRLLLCHRQCQSVLFLPTAGWQKGMTRNRTGAPHLGHQLQPLVQRMLLSHLGQWQLH